jgi:hypothetical protein
MGLGFFVMVEPESPDFSGHLRYAKALVGGALLLAGVARQLHARPLDAFFSTEPRLTSVELGELVRDGVLPPAVLPDPPPEEKWFEPGEGLASASALLSHVEDHEGGYPSDLRAALAEFVGVLEEVRKRGLRWHLEVF